MQRCFAPQNAVLGFVRGRGSLRSCLPQAPHDVLELFSRVLPLGFGGRRAGLEVRAEVDLLGRFRLGLGRGLRVSLAFGTCGLSRRRGLPKITAQFGDERLTILGGYRRHAWKAAKVTWLEIRTHRRGPQKSTSLDLGLLGRRRVVGAIHARGIRFLGPRLVEFDHPRRLIRGRRGRLRFGRFRLVQSSLEPAGTLGRAPPPGIHSLGRT